MKKYVIAATALLISGSVWAADMPIKAPVYKAAPSIVAPSWSGIYFGGQVGYAWSRNSYSYNNGGGTIENFSHDPASVIGGGHIGVQHQWGSWVAGLEATWSATDMKDTQPSILIPPRFRTLKISQIATVVGKLGHASGNVLIYVKGGWAIAKINTFAIHPPTGTFADATEWNGGWTVGAGVDYMVLPHFVIGVDFNYYDFGFDHSAISSMGGFVSTWSGSSEVYAVMGRASYLFSIR